MDLVISVAKLATFDLIYLEKGIYLKYFISIIDKDNYIITPQKYLKLFLLIFYMNILRHFLIAKDNFGVLKYFCRVLILLPLFFFQKKY